MNKVIDIMASLLKSILILWIPILLIEETFFYEYIGPQGSFIFSIIASILCFIVYKKGYKKVDRIDCYFYNIINAILLVITNVILGYFFLYLIDIEVFHQCTGSGWDCFLFGIEYLFIGFEYAFLSIIVLVIWLFVKLIKFLNYRKK